MSDNLHKRHLDANEINIHQPYELRDWANKLEVTKEELIDAVKVVGPTVAKVKTYLKK